MSSDRDIGIMDILVNPMKVTLKQFFKSTFGKPTTVMYPLEKRDPPPTYRGMNAVIWDLCIGCGICGEVCHNKCLKMKPTDLYEEEKDKLLVLLPHSLAGAQLVDELSEGVFA